MNQLITDVVLCAFFLVGLAFNIWMTKRDHNWAPILVYSGGICMVGVIGTLIFIYRHLHLILSR